jgi:hypothetical protein
LGAFIRNIILALIGYAAHGQKEDGVLPKHETLNKTEQG